MKRKNINSKEVFAFTKDGKFIGNWQSIADAAIANNTSTASVSTGLANKDHFSVGRYWVSNKEDVFYAMILHNENMKKEKEMKELQKSLNQYTQTLTERHGDYVFVKSDLSGDECCRCCALYDSSCLPCRTHEKHDNGYWVYKKQRSHL